jgi:hypothetical protein
MPHCSLLKALRVEQPTGVQPLLLSRGLYLWRLWSVSPFFPMARFSRWLLSNCSRCYLLNAVRLKRFPDKARAGPVVPPSSSISGCGFDVSSFILEEADSSTMPSRSLPVTRWKSQLLASQPPVRESAWRSCWMPSCFLDVAAVSGLGPFYHFCV